MIERLDRRSALKAVAASAALGVYLSGGVAALAKSSGLKLSTAKPFSFETLKEKAKNLAKADYVGPAHPAPDIVSKIDYEAWGKIKYDTNQALFVDGPGRYPVTFFHLGMFFQKSVKMSVIDQGRSREILYSPSYFDMPEDSVAHQLPSSAGFAGFRIQEARNGELDWRKNDWVAFLGASYFRSIGELHQYGLSARGLALNTASANMPEEFPDFIEFYISESDAADAVTVYALLDGPSVTGAYKFILTRGKGVIMEIDQTLYLRKPVARFGLAPLTSMYWFSDTAKPTAVDWRPEVHDSDGLAMWTGWGEHLWRPLNNPPHTVASAFGDTNPKGYGLLQRDRNFDHYQDGVYYDRRPSLWVEPKGSWGKGSVQLIEIPTDDEIHDNIVAMWVPEPAPAAGAEINLAYKLYWQAEEPYPSELARCVATRLGNGGQPGQPRPQDVRKFVVEFLGGPLAHLPYGMKPEMVLETSRGYYTNYRLMEAVPDAVAGHWRAQFDLAGVTGPDPAEMRLHLTVDGKIVTETWLYQYYTF